MTRKDRDGLIASLRMLGLVNPQKWGLLDAAAAELKRLEASLDKAHRDAYADPVAGFDINAAVKDSD